ADCKNYNSGRSAAAALRKYAYYWLDGQKIFNIVAVAWGGDGPGHRKSSMVEVQPAPATLSSACYARLRGDILQDALPPGRKLRIEEACARTGATSTPVREALNQLAKEGFVQRREQRGFMVAEVSAAELAEMTDTRCWVGPIALREAIVHRSQCWGA